MTNFKKTLLGVAAAMALAAPAANAIVVGGIDFGPAGAAGNHFETTTLAQQFINGDGQNAFAYGRVSDVNGETNYCAVGSCTLYYIAEFLDSSNFSANSVEFSSATLSVYISDAGPVNLLTNGNSPTNLFFISGLTEWAKFNSHGIIKGTGALLGSVLSGNGAGLFDVDLTWGIPAVANFLDSNGIPDNLGGFADLDLNSSFTNNQSRLNKKDNLNGCFDGTAAAGQWCYAGSADISGLTNIPEPASLALLGIGLLGLGGMSARKRAKA